jgi:hypothetical protein
MSIKGSHEDIEDVVDPFPDGKCLDKSSAASTSCSSIASSDSESNLRPIGAAVLPTGWHRHPHHNHQGSIFTKLHFGRKLFGCIINPQILNRFLPQQQI